MYHPFVDLDIEPFFNEAKNKIKSCAWEGSESIRDFLESIDMDQDDDFTIAKNPEYEDAFDSFIDDHLNCSFRTLNATLTKHLSEDGFIKVYRALVVDEGWVETSLHSQPAGVCWSFDRSTARPYCGGDWSKGRIDIIMHGYVHFDNIEWNETLQLYLEGEYTVGMENEIRLLPEALIALEGIEQTHSNNPKRWAFDPEEVFLTAGDASYEHSI